jgi:hypothetical protein
VMYHKTNFENLSGSAVISNQYNPSLALITQNSGIVIKSFQSNINTQFLEGSTFVGC